MKRKVAGDQGLNDLLEECCEIVQFIAIQTEILLHPRDVSIALKLQSDIVRKY